MTITTPATHVEHRRCAACKRSCPINMFTKNNKILKTCITCRDNVKKRAEQRLREDPEGFITKRRASSRKHRQKMLCENPEGLRKKELENAQKYREKMSRENPERLREMIRNTNKKSREKKMKEDPDGFRHLENVRKKAYRQRKIEENPEELRARELAITMKYINANRETVRTRSRERNRLSVTVRLHNIKNGANSRGYEWTLDDDAAMAMQRGPCFYCGIVVVDRVNGLDRTNNLIGYTPDNTVGCCAVCNTMKKCLDAHTFVDRCVHLCGLGKHASAWPDTNPGGFHQYRRNAKTKNRAFELTKKAYDELINQPCVYCRRDITETNRSGIDRIDNDLGYVSGNMQPCCSECNVMRGALTVEAFLEKASRIAARAELLLIPEMPACLTAVTPRKRKQTGPAAPSIKQKQKKRGRPADAVPA